MKKALLFFFFIAGIFRCHSQNKVIGKVSIADLKENVYEKDTTAVAVILYKKRKTYFDYKEIDGFFAVHQYQIRIKIYKKEGLDWANFEIPYYVGYENIQDDVLRSTDGVTYNLENGDIVKTKLKSEGIFNEKISDNWKKVSLTMPNVRVGSVIELNYTIESHNLVKFPVFDIQSAIPVQTIEYQSEIPTSYVYKSVVKGSVPVKFDSKLKQGSISFTNQHGLTNLLNFQQVNSQFRVNDVPALVDEKFVDNLSNYSASLNCELEKILIPGQPDKDYSNTWEGVANSIYSYKDFGAELEKRDYLLSDLRNLMKGQKDSLSKLQKVNVIFKYVQQRMNWNDVYGYYTDKGVVKAYEDKIGNVADINFILIAMLKFAGLEAEPVLVSTKSHGIPVFPNRTGFNYVIAAAEIDGETVLLDATSKNTTVNILPLNVINWYGRLIRNDGTTAKIDLVPIKPSVINCNLGVRVSSTGKLVGNYTMQKTDYEAFKFRENQGKISQDRYTENKENEYSGIQIKDYSIVNDKADMFAPVVEKISFESNNHCEVIGGKMYINPLLFFKMYKNPFDQEKRVMPIYFEYPKHEKYSVFFEIPEGFVVESLPTPVKLVLNEKDLKFTLNCQVVGNTIQIRIVNELNIGICASEDYVPLKSFFQQMVDKQNEKIVLKKM